MIKTRGGEVFYIDLDADAGGDVTDDGLGHAVDADGLSGEGVLKQTDGGAGECSCDGISSGDREEDRDDEGKIKDGKPREGVSGEAPAARLRRAAPAQRRRGESYAAQALCGMCSCGWP